MGITSKLGVMNSILSGTMMAVQLIGEEGQGPLSWYGPIFGMSGQT